MPGSVRPAVPGALPVGRDHIGAAIDTLVPAGACTLVRPAGLMAAMPITTVLEVLLAVHVPAREADPCTVHVRRRVGLG